jgi:hypothetical protein
MDNTVENKTGRTKTVSKITNSLYGTSTKSNSHSNASFLTAFLCSALRLLVTANIVPSSPILVTMTMEALRSPETLAVTRATRRDIPGDGILRKLLSLNILDILETIDFEYKLPYCMCSI